jgi:hypothetical protein
VVFNVAMICVLKSFGGDGGEEVKVQWAAVRGTGGIEG